MGPASIACNKGDDSCFSRAHYNVSRLVVNDFESLPLVVFFDGKNLLLGYNVIAAK